MWIVRGRLPLLLVSSTFVTACSAVLGLRDIDADSTVTPPTDAGVDTFSPDDGAATHDVMSVPDATTDADVDAGGVCAARTTLLCDSFESGALSPMWRKSFVNGDAHVVARPAGTPDRFFGRAAFDPIPATGKALLGIDNMPIGKRSIRFTLDVPDDSYPGAGMPIAGIVDGDDGVQILLVPSGSNLTLVAKDTRGGTPTSAVQISKSTPTCVELEIDTTGSLKLWKGTALLTGTVTTTTANNSRSAEIGLRWSFGANPGASVITNFDDVIVATGAVGCP